MEIFCFNKNQGYKGERKSEILGKKGHSVNRLADLGLNIVPSFFIGSDDFKNLDVCTPKDLLKIGVNSIEEITKKKFGASKDPLFLEVFLSPSIEIEIDKSIQGIGYNNGSVKCLAGQTSNDFAYLQYKKFLLNFVKCHSNLKTINELTLNKIKELPLDKACSSILDIWKSGFPVDPYEQLQRVLFYFKESFYKNILNKNIACAVGVRAMVFGNYSKDSCTGRFYTRNVFSGDAELQGGFSKNTFIKSKKTEDIKNLSQGYLKNLEKVAYVLDGYFKEIRMVNFVIEQKDVWIVDEFRTEEKSVKASIRVLIDLHIRGTIDDDYFLKNIGLNEITSLLHPVISPSARNVLEYIDIGEIGSMGVARGRVYFSTDKLLKAYKDAIIKKEDSDVILCMAATYASDVKAIEIGNGVVCSEGGYASHAPVVARSLGKPAILGKKLDIGVDSVMIGDSLVKEGDYISIEVPAVGSPRIYFGKVELEFLDAKASGLKRIMEIVSRKIQIHQKKHQFKFNVLANADTANDIETALQFGADGVGLCRTEHMFFEKERINYFRLLFVSDLQKIRKIILNKLKEIQKNDFAKMLRVLKGKLLTVRLLDAPLHEFIPNTKQDIAEIEKVLLKHDLQFKEDINVKFRRLRETNPMLGMRGCRFGISFPDVYEMQEQALLEAAIEYYNENDARNEVNLKIMFPLISYLEELDFLKNGMNIEGHNILGLKGVEQAICNKYNIATLPFTVETGVMIEVPSAALLSGKLAEKASFFSFGTNDLVQMMHGMSRDDINSFYPAYTQYDIIKDNPFIVLSDVAKRLILYSINEGRLTRPDLYASICGEHAADPRVVRFCIQNKIDAVSCSAFCVPLIRLVIAQYFID